MVCGVLVLEGYARCRAELGRGIVVCRGMLTGLRYVMEERVEWVGGMALWW